jgi:methylmalonyl-CoA/ethylmalonyl-CoA epimerase
MPVNHIAFLVPSVQKAADYLEKFNFIIGPAEEWEGEGTLEIYIGDKARMSSLLLLMEPVKDGAYARAIKKRGPGLHHIAVDVSDLDSYIDNLSGSGWLLHPKSLKTVKASRTAWLARPGIPTLIEVQERENLDEKPPFIDEIGIPHLSQKQLEMFSILGLKEFHARPCLDLLIQHSQIPFENLL